MFKYIVFIFFLILCFSFSEDLFPETKFNKKLISEAKLDKNTSRIVNVAEETRNIIILEINGTINPAILDYLNDGFKKANKNDSEAVVILLDTPGGLLTSTKEIVKLLLNSEIPSIVYVSPSGATATSAGVFITLASNIAAMAPGTSIGAAHPVSLAPRGNQPANEGEKDKDVNSGSKDKIAEKIENYASSFIESIAEQRGRNVNWAIEAVRNSASITAIEAMEKGVIDIISPNLDQLMIDIDGKKVNLPGKERKLITSNVTYDRIEMNAKQIFINILSTPDIAFLLLSLGSLGLLLEFYNPGLIFPGVAGLLCLLLGFVSFQLIPFNYGGLVLLAMAIGLFIAEVYVTSFGLLSIGGILCFAIGALLLFDTTESDIRVGYQIIIATTLAIGLFFFYVIYYLIKAQKLKHNLGFEGMIDTEGIAETDINKDGKIFVNGEYWNAESDELIIKGDKVKVVEAHDNFRIKVKKVNN